MVLIMKRITDHLKLFLYLLLVVGICWIPIAATGCSKDSGEQQPSTPGIQKPEPYAKIKETVAGLMEKEEIPGLSMTIIKDGKLWWSEGFGVKSKKSDKPVTADTVFEACSLSKPVFAYAVLKLIEEGKLDLDTPLVNYVPEMSYLEKEFLNEKIKDQRLHKITARHVLTHTTGFPNWRNKKTISIQFEPGEKFSYSGEGFVYLQKVVEKITGKPLNDLMMEYVFQPLGMTHSSYIWQERYETLAASAHSGFGFAKPLRKRKKANGAASLYTTAPDFARFVCALLAGSGLSEKMHRQMLHPAVTAPYDKEGRIAWGLGVALQRLKKEDEHAVSLWHWGDNEDFKCFFVGLLEEKTGLVYFTNSFFGLNIVKEMVMETIGGQHPVLSIPLFKDYNGERGLFIKTIKTKEPKEVTAFFEKMVEKQPFLKKRVVVPHVLGFFLEAARWLEKNKKSDHAVQLLSFIKEQYPMEKYRDYSAVMEKLKIVEQKLKELQK
jgi:CubicO group peptidase (beta-lactamase class C family)